MAVREVAVIGVGMHKFGRFPDTDVLEMARVAVFNALKDANVQWKDVQTAVCGSGRVFTGGNLAGAKIGFTGIPIITVSNACATGQSAFRLAYHEVASGFYDVAVAFGMDKMPKGFMAPSDGDLENYRRYRLWGIPNPGYWALTCSRYMQRYGMGEAPLVKISIKNHKNGALNPYAHYQKAMTYEEIANSPYVCTPLRLMEICVPNEGAAAVVMCRKDIASRFTSKHPITISAATLQSRRYGSEEIMAFDCSYSARGKSITVTQAAAKVAYEESGIGPEDVDFVELQDGCSWSEIEYAEDLGLAKEGEGWRLIEEGTSEIGGRLPINPSGGLISCGEPIGASGMRQVVEAVWHLRGEAGDRQVQGAKVGLCHTRGGAGNGSVVILKR